MAAVDLTPAATAHRPWPAPSEAWALSMRWAALTFLHWPVAPEALRPLVPEALTLDTFEGEAYVGVVPFRMERTQLRGLPLLPGTHTFGEFNVRTYVRHRAPDGAERAGVWFFSLDAASFLAVWAARLSFGLPYFTADVTVATDLSDASAVAEATPDAVRYYSRRTHRGAPAATFRAVVRPEADASLAPPGSLTHWFTERYALFAERFGRLVIGDVHHAPWPLRRAEARIETNTLASASGIALPDAAPLVHYADAVDVVAWPPRRLGA